MNILELGEVLIDTQDHSNEKIAPIEGAEIINDDKKTTKVFNTFFHI